MDHPRAGYNYIFRFIGVQRKFIFSKIMADFLKFTISSQNKIIKVFVPQNKGRVISKEFGYKFTALR
jgi:hypothetical protein